MTIAVMAYSIVVTESTPKAMCVDTVALDNRVSSTATVLLVNAAILMTNVDQKETAIWKV